MWNHENSAIITKTALFPVPDAGYYKKCQLYNDHQLKNLHCVKNIT